MARKKKEVTAVTVIPPLDLKREPTSKDNLDYWVSWVADGWYKSIENIIETGRRIAKLYAEFEEEGQKAIVERLRIPQPTVSKLMAIGTCAVIIEYSKWNKLPPSWTTIYELTKLPPDLLREKLESGEINATTKGKDIAKLIEAEAPAKGGDEDPEPKARRSSINEWDMISDDLDNCSSAVELHAKQLVQKARASGKNEEELVKADSIEELFDEKIERIRGLLKKLRLDLEGSPVTTAVHIGPGGKRRTRK